MIERARGHAREGLTQEEAEAILTVWFADDEFFSPSPEFEGTVNAAVAKLRALASPAVDEQERCSRCGAGPDEKCPEDGPGLRVNTRMCPRKRPTRRPPAKGTLCGFCFYRNSASAFGRCAHCGRSLSGHLADEKRRALEDAVRAVDGPEGDG